MALELNIDKSKIDPMVGEIKEKYLQHLVAAAVIALLLWFITPNSYGNYVTMMANFAEPLIFLLVTMVISYMILVIGGSDALMSRLKDSGVFDSMNSKLTIATVLSLGSYFLYIMVGTYFNWVRTNFSMWGETMTTHEVMFIVMMFIISLALVFFVSVVLALMKIADMRTA